MGIDVGVWVLARATSAKRFCPCSVRRAARFLKIPEFRWFMIAANADVTFGTLRNVCRR